MSTWPKDELRKIALLRLERVLLRVLVLIFMTAP